MDLTIVDAPGKGRGVFAARPFKAGERLMMVSGGAAPARGPHTIQVDWDAHIKPEAPFLFTNHSCEPNAGFKTDASGRVALHARVDIGAGEEIVWDYAMSESDLAPMACSCGATGCRGVIAGGWDGLSEARRRDYREWAMPYLLAPGK